MTAPTYSEALHGRKSRAWTSANYLAVCDGGSTSVLVVNGALLLIAVRDEWPRGLTFDITVDEAEVLADLQEEHGDPPDQAHDTREAVDKLRGNPNPHTPATCPICAELES